MTNEQMIASANFHAKEMAKKDARIAVLEAALKPIERVKGFSNMTEWIPASAVKDDETIQVQMTGAEFKAARAAYLGEKK